MGFSGSRGFRAAFGSNARGSSLCFGQEAIEGLAA